MMTGTTTTTEAVSQAYHPSEMDNVIDGGRCQGRGDASLLQRSVSIAEPVELRITDYVTDDYIGNIRYADDVTPTREITPSPATTRVYDVSPTFVRSRSPSAALQASTPKQWNLPEPLYDNVSADSSSPIYGNETEDNIYDDTGSILTQLETDSTPSPELYRHAHSTPAIFLTDYDEHALVSASMSSPTDGRSFSYTRHGSRSSDSYGRYNLSGQSALRFGDHDHFRSVLTSTRIEYDDIDITMLDISTISDTSDMWIVPDSPAISTRRPDTTTGEARPDNYISLIEHYLIRAPPNTPTSRPRTGSLTRRSRDEVVTFDRSPSPSEIKDGGLRRSLPIPRGKEMREVNAKEAACRIRDSKKSVSLSEDQFKVRLYIGCILVYIYIYRFI